MISFIDNQLSWRINVLFVFFLCFAGLLIFRFADLQVISNGKNGDSSDQAYFQDDEFYRAEIFLQDRAGEVTPLAVNKDFFVVYVEPVKINNKEETAKILSEILNIPYDKIFQKISKENDPYEILAKKADDNIISKVKELKLAGVGIQAQKGRYYPYQRAASHVAGFLGVSANRRMGQYGAEGFYDSWLASKKTEKIVLSLDPNIQFKIEEALKKLAEQWKITGGSAIVMELKTGKILGMANFPNFDPNNYSAEEDIGVFNNLSISGQFELGSVFKPVTMAAGLNEVLITPKTTYEDQGFVVVDDRVIKNWDRKPRGETNMTEVLKNSLNAGIVFVQQKIPKNVFRDYIKKFGFGEKTGVDLAGEVDGNIANLRGGKNVDYANISFGQGISVTPLQMLVAISAIGNNGVLVRPHIADKIFFTDGSVEEIKPNFSQPVVSSKTSETLTRMLVEAVENHSKARNFRYFIAGKTGTAQIPDRNAKSGYSDEMMIHSVAGYAPAYNPRFSVLIKIDRPQGVEFAAYSVVPAFYEIMNYLLTYYEIPPDF